MSAFKQFAWLPYFILCLGIIMLFGTEEWMLLYKYKSPNEAVDMQAQYYNKRIFRRDVDDSDMISLIEEAKASSKNFQLFNLGAFDVYDGIAKEIESEKDYYRNVLTKMLYQISEKNVPTSPQAESAPLLEKSDKLYFNDEPLNLLNEPILTKPKVKRSTQGQIVQMDAPGEGDEVTPIAPSVHKATPNELRQSMAPLGSPPPNRRFVFHNKIPKAGSTTMKWLLVALSKRNGFTLDHARWCLNEGHCADHDPVTGRHVDGPDGEQAMVDYIPKKREEIGDEKYLLLKHHHYFNFTQFDMEEPTYINVARDPVTRYASWYYFERYGWARQEGSRSRFFGDEEDKMRTLDECVLGEYAECLEPVQVMVKYFCGTDIKQCGMMSTDGHDWTKVAEATERAKRIIAQNFYVVGVLEHFTTTLALFEKMLPEYYEGAVEASQTPEQLKQRESSKSSNPGLSNATRHALETGVLRYEVDIYNFVKSLFFEKLDYYNIPRPIQT